MSIYTVINQVQSILVDIETNTTQMNQHRSNARIANTGAALAYLLTSNSKNSTVRTVGQVASIGGVIYGNSQSNQATSIEQKIIIYLSQIISIIELEGLQNIRQERDVNVITNFLRLNLQTGKYLDSIVDTYISRFRSKGHLGKNNITLLFNASNIDVFNYKLRMNKVYASLDASKRITHIESEFKNNVSYVSMDKVIREGMLARIIIIASVIIGFIGAQYVQNAYLLTVAGLLFWGINHYFPLFPETKKLRNVVGTFLGDLKATCGINNINFK